LRRRVVFATNTYGSASQDKMGRLAHPKFLRQASTWRFSIEANNTYLVSSDAVIAIAFGLITTIIRILSAIIAYLTLRAMNIESCTPQ
jgi:hypothetical protein